MKRALTLLLLVVFAASLQVVKMAVRDVGPPVDTMSTDYGAPPQFLLSETMPEQDVELPPTPEISPTQDQFLNDWADGVCLVTDAVNTLASECAEDVCQPFREYSSAPSKIGVDLSIAPKTETEPVVIGRSMRLSTYTAKWCLACKKMETVFDRLRDDGYQIVIIDADNPSDGFQPKEIPLTALFDGDDFLGQWVGMVSEEELRQALQYGEGILPLVLGQVLYSPRSNDLDEAAKQAAQLQADRDRQGHYEWNQRRNKIIQQCGYRAVEEICAESWPEQEKADEVDLWAEAFKSWSQSPGHWRIANNRWRAYGRAKAKGKSGVWYFTIIVASNNTMYSHETPASPENGQQLDVKKSGDAGFTNNGCATGSCSKKIFKRSRKR